MKRFGLLMMVAAALGATGAVALGPVSSMPDMTRQYYERSNCHQAYDLVAEDMANGNMVNAADKAWALSYESAAEAGGKCPAPGEALAKRAVNRIESTQQGLGKLLPYMNAGDPAAYFEAGTAVINDKLPSLEKAQGVAMIQKSAELGYAPGQYMLALFRIGGAFGTQDYAGGLPLIEQAAATGHVDALFQAGNFYKDGIGTKKDSAKAFNYYLRAAEQGHLYAAYLAFYMAQDGEGTKKDFKLAYTIARNLADHGQAIGAVLSASALLQQKNAVGNEDEVLYWMDVAIRDGDDKIRTEVGKFRPRVVAAFKRAKAPPEYHPRERKACPLKTVCYVDRFSGAQDCHTNVDYWHDCDF